MKTIRSQTIEKPKFVSEVVIKTRPELKVVSLPGKGDPMETFDKKLSQVLSWLKHKGIRQTKGPAIGIYYKNRNDVGVKNVKWDACVIVDEDVKTEAEIKFEILPERKVASIILTGNYDLIGPALNYLEEATKENGIQTEWPLTEIYLEEGEKPITELQYFVKKIEITLLS